MKRVLSIATCSILAACSCSDNQWENVDTVTYDETVYEAPAPIAEEEVYVRPEPVYVQAPQPVYDCPCAEVQPQPCYQPTCYQPCSCQPMMMPAPQPKITKTKKIVTTTTTIEEPCGKPVCEPVVTTHEEIIPVDADYISNNDYTHNQHMSHKQPATQNDYVEVTVEKNPYRSEVVSMSSSSSEVAENNAAKYSPEAYIVVATRATNRMLQDTSAIYDSANKKTIYIKDIKLLSSDLPYGSHRLKGAVKDIISGSKTYDVVNNSSNADYIVDSSADWYVSDNATPALQYKLSLLDKNGKKVNEWVEIIRQVQE